MRYLCRDCGSLVKDKFIFGLLHFCSSFPPTHKWDRVEAFNAMIRRYHEQGIQASPEEMDEMIRTGLTVRELREKS